MRDQCRWFGGMVGNHVADIVDRYGDDRRRSRRRSPTTSRAARATTTTSTARPATTTPTSCPTRSSTASASSVRSRRTSTGWRSCTISASTSSRSTSSTTARTTRSLQYGEHVIPALNEQAAGQRVVIGADGGPGAIGAASVACCSAAGGVCCGSSTRRSAPRTVVRSSAGGSSRRRTTGRCRTRGTWCTARSTRRCAAATADLDRGCRLRLVHVPHGARRAGARCRCRRRAGRGHGALPCRRARPAAVCHHLADHAVDRAGAAGRGRSAATGIFRGGPWVGLRSARSWRSSRSSCRRCAGLQSAPAGIARADGQLRRSWCRTLRKLRFPAAVPYIVPGLKLAATASVIGVIVSEISTGVRGVRVRRARPTARRPPATRPRSTQPCSAQRCSASLMFGIVVAVEARS